MKAYQVQFELPCQYPANNVRMKKRRKVITFYVPLNLPEIHNLTYSQLLTYSALSESLDLCTALNTDRVLVEEALRNKEVVDIRKNLAQTEL